ncbi:DMT family protein [bacterium]|nr:DMT family protein [candidate division CSSED10-310 bacterium]
MNPYVITVSLLCCSNLFMTLAWYGHLKTMSHRTWILAALVSWGIALFEYLLQVPANRIGHTVMSVGQLKLIQEVITLSVFVPFSIVYLKEKVTMDYLYAGICILMAVFFVFRRKMTGF